MGRAAFKTMAEKASAGGMDAVVDIAVLRIFHPAYLEANPHVIEERRDVLRKLDPQAFAQCCRALETMDLRPGLASITMPVLVIVGALDAATPPPLGRALADGVAGARFVEIPDCGHCPPLEAPDKLLALIEPFLA